MKIRIDATGADGKAQTTTLDVAEAKHRIALALGSLLRMPASTAITLADTYVKASEQNPMDVYKNPRDASLPREQRTSKPLFTITAIPE